MAQWINVLRNNGFVNPTRLLLLCEKTGALAIVEPGLTAGWQSVVYMVLVLCFCIPCS